MQRSPRRFFAMFVLLILAPLAHGTEPGDCLTPDEAELLELINQYRQSNGLLAAPWSKSLSMVGQWHVWDLVNNDPVGGQCNAHSWSDWGDLWTPVCYTSDHAQAQGMWDKPREITDNLYTGNGFEIAAWTSGSYLSPDAALAAWQGSPGHNDVILNQGMWSSLSPWPAMGVGMLNGYAVVWFGDTTDPAGTIAECAQAVFSDDFESGNTNGWTTTFP